MILKLRNLALTFVLLLCSQVTVGQSAVYEVTFTGTWSENDATSFPSSAHFTELVGATHATGAQFWEVGGLASQGIEEVAETGALFSFSSEVNSAQRNGVSGSMVTFESLFSLPGESSTQRIEANENHPYITLISMIAPSPDWFVGVSNVPLQSNGQWRSVISIDLLPYDAGTEDGDEFSLANPETTPKQAITPLEQSPFFGRPSLGRLEFTLLSPTPPSSTNPNGPQPSANASTLNALAPVINLVLSEEESSN